VEVPYALCTYVHIHIHTCICTYIKISSHRHRARRVNETPKIHMDPA